VTSIWRQFSSKQVPSKACIFDYHCIKQEDAVVVTRRYSSELLNLNQAVELSDEVAADGNRASFSDQIVPELGQWYAVCSE